MSSKLFKKGYLPPEFCIIAPTAYLPTYATQSKTHLALAHLVASDEAYADFYQQRSQAGDRVIMDNGAFELGESYAPSKLIKLGKRIGAQALVLPDYPFQPADKTIQAAIKYTPLFKKEGFSTFFVPQSKRGDWDDWMAGYKWAANESDVDIIGMSILGIPNSIPHIPTPYARVVAAEVLLRTGNFAHHKHHHWLGLNSGPKLEIPPLLKMGVLDTCDSSNPTWMAILGHEYSHNTDSFLSVSKVKKEVEFDFPWISDEATHRRIQHNINLTKSLFV